MFDTYTESKFHASPGKKKQTLVGLLVLTIALLVAASTAQAQSSTFMYQGRLTDAGASANGLYDLEFKLYNAGSVQIGGALTREDVQVTDGVFTVQLDFDQPPFTTGAANTLEIGVRPGASTGAFTALAPRQPLTSSPYAIQTINAAQLGGVPASQYVKTDDPRLGGAGGNFIQNTTTPQAGANFNVAGNGVIGGSVGIGTPTPAAGLKLDVNGLARIMPGGTGGAIQFGTPNFETGMTISNATTRADLRFDGSTFKLVAGPAGGPPSNFSGIAVHTSGNVGIGTTAPTTKLHVIAGSGQPAIYGQSSNRAVSGLGTGNGSGVYGESASGIGVLGDSGGGIGVQGLGNSVNGTGVFGRSAYGQGVRGDSLYGYAFYANGNAGQALDRSGFVKAMLFVDYFLPANQRVVRCYNGLTNTSTGDCGFKVKVLNPGEYEVDFGFPVYDRFYSLTVVSPVSARVGGKSSTPNVLYVYTKEIPGIPFQDNSKFYLIVY